MYVLAGIAVGAGASAVATILFTQALSTAIRSRPSCCRRFSRSSRSSAPGSSSANSRRRFAWFLLPALAGIWLIAFPHPLEVHARGLTPIAEALGAAVLWGLGTVFGRFLGGVSLSSTW